MDKIAIPLKSGGASGKSALTRLSVCLAAVMLRRTKTTTIEGKPLLNLPTRTVNELRVKFGAGEQRFYNAIEAKMKETAKAIHRSADTGNKAMVGTLKSNL
jgi:SNF2 family DNA or RNA helicase